MGCDCQLIIKENDDNDDDMPYQFAMACANFSSLHALREDLNGFFFQKDLD